MISKLFNDSPEEEKPEADDNIQYVPVLINGEIVQMPVKWPKPQMGG